MSDDARVEQLRSRLVAFYQVHNPEKLRNQDEIDKTVRRYVGKEDKLFRDLEKKYVDKRYRTQPSTRDRLEAERSATNAPKGTRSVIEGLKQIYKYKVRPLEEMYDFPAFASPTLTDTDFDAKPMVLLMGQYSVGKTTFIRYLLERDFKGMRIGPEPTTDHFSAVIHGFEERTIPGHAAIADATKPFTALERFGSSFMQKFDCVEMPAPILESITFVDTPGVLSGEKQRIGRAYDFPEVSKWFAERADRILLLFDAHKLDISDEFRQAIESLRGHDDKIRCVLNKSDMVDKQALMRVYGALMWSLGKVVKTPEVLRVFVSSFWDKPYNETGLAQADLFDAEKADLLNDLRSLPRHAAVRKINEAVKRARLVRTHALILNHLRGQFGWFGKDKTKRKVLNNLEEHFRAIQRQHNIPSGDFPNPRVFRELLQQHDLSKFPKLDQKMLDRINEALSLDVPRLMRQLPGIADNADSEAIEGEAVNPFDAAEATPDAAVYGETGWCVSSIEKDEYDNLFFSQQLRNGKLSGAQARQVMLQSQLPPTLLRQIWELGDMDRDGMLDNDEFAVVMHLCKRAERGEAIPTTLEPELVPPSKRGAAGTDKRL